MNIKQIGKLYVAYAPGGYRLPGSHKLRQQAEAAYIEYIRAKVITPVAAPEPKAPNRFKPKAKTNDTTNVST